LDISRAQLLQRGRSTPDEGVQALVVEDSGDLDRVIDSQWLQAQSFGLDHFCGRPDSCRRHHDTVRT
jgi:hypothetical protein